MPAARANPAKMRSPRRVVGRSVGSASGGVSVAVTGLLRCTGAAARCPDRRTLVIRRQDAEIWSTIPAASSCNDESSGAEPASSAAAC